MVQDIKETFYFEETIKISNGVTVYGHGHCIVGFGITNLLSNEEIIPIIPFFHLENMEVIKETFIIKFRIYPEGNQYYEIEINPFKKIFKFNNSFYPTDEYYKTIINSEISPKSSNTA